MKTIETLQRHDAPTGAAIDAFRRVRGIDGTRGYAPVVVAFEWLDAQILRQNLNHQQVATKRLIEDWAGLYVSADDVTVAAALHPLIRGDYPGFNLSSRRVWPNEARLEGIAAAHIHNYTEDNREMNYAMEETFIPA